MIKNYASTNNNKAMKNNSTMPQNRTKIVATVGEVTKKLTVQAHRFSKIAADKITKAGGTPEVLSKSPIAAAV